jgi:hypothetical protein
VCRLFAISRKTSCRRKDGTLVRGVLGGEAESKGTGLAGARDPVV